MFKILTLQELGLAFPKEQRFSPKSAPHSQHNSSSCSSAPLTKNKTTLVVTQVLLPGKQILQRFKLKYFYDFMVDLHKTSHFSIFCMTF